MLRCDEAHEGFGVIEFDEGEYFFLTRKGENKNAVLQFVKTDGFQVGAENVAKLPVFFWDIKQGYSPEPIPVLGFFDFDTKELLKRSGAFPFFCQEKRD